MALSVSSSQKAQRRMLGIQELIRSVIELLLYGKLHVASSGEVSRSFFILIYFFCSEFLYLLMFNDVCKCVLRVCSVLGDGAEG